MNRFGRFCAILLCMAASSAYAQQSAIYTHENAAMQKALELYRLRQYSAAETLFRQVKEDTREGDIESEAAYYEANAAIRSNRLGADSMMERFVEAYPTSIRRESAFLEVGNYYFTQGQYAKALTWYDKIADNSLPNASRNAFFFKKGYAYFVSKNPKQASKYLEIVRNDAEYGAQAKYYLGYMAYSSDQYTEADTYFEQVDPSSPYAKQLSYYQADMNFKLGNFEKAITLAKEQLPEAKGAELSQINKIIGESYFNLQQYEAAIPYLLAYKGERGSWSQTDYYQLGYAFYKQRKYPEAISEFNKIVSGNNSVAQNAYYHLGECYLKTEQKSEALNAFRNASQMSFDPIISKDARLNYARLSYEVGNPFESVPKALLGYLESYGDSKEAPEIKELLISAFISTGDYKEALNLLDKNKGLAGKEIYQQIALYYGLDLFTQGELTESRTTLEKAFQTDPASAAAARAVYWQAEIAYRNSDYAKALEGYQNFSKHPAARQTPEYKDYHYQMGYAAFELQQYKEAAGYFDVYVKSAPESLNEQLEDAWIRLGDSHFGDRAYWPALEAYNKVIEAGTQRADYAAYQKALGYGLLDRTASKTEILEGFEQVYPRSPLRDDALYELGNTLVNQGNPSEGLDVYERMAEKYPMSSLVAPALLKSGLAYYNQGDNTRALDIFKRLASKYKSSDEAMTAVSTARQIYVDEGRVGEYATWVGTLGFVDISQAELDKASFEAAEKALAQQQNKKGISLLQSYLKEFPNGLQRTRAYSLLGRSLREEGDLSASVNAYSMVWEAGPSEYREESAMVLAGESLDQKKFREALPYLEWLDTESTDPSHKAFALSNLMRSHYELKDDTRTLTYARRVLESSGLNEQVVQDARLMVARTSFRKGDFESARNGYGELVRTANGSALAEGLYHQALFTSRDGNHEESNALVQRLVRELPEEREWAGKGLLIMASNFEAMNDLFQATYILESVVERFSGYPEIVSKAKEELQLLKARQENNLTTSPKN